MQERQEEEYGSPNKVDGMCQLSISLATYIEDLHEDNPHLISSDPRDT